MALLLTEAAIVRGSFSAYDAVTSPALIPQCPPVGRGLTAVVGSDPTSGSLPGDTYNSVTAETKARASLRTDGDGSGNRYARGLAATTVAQLASRVGACTATMVESRSERVAVTAAHCVYWPATHPDYRQPDNERVTVGWKQLVAFIPGRSGSREPFGKWPIEGAWIDPVWSRTGDPRYDVAFLRLGTREGKTPQRVLGAEGIVFDSQPGGGAIWRAPTDGSPVTVPTFVTGTARSSSSLASLAGPRIMAT